MEENSKIETSADNSGGGSMLYSAEPHPQAQESGHSSVYGGELPQQETREVPTMQLTEPQQPVQLAKPTEPPQPSKPTEPVPPSKPTEPVQLSKPTEPVQLVKPSGASPDLQPLGSVQLTEPVQTPVLPVPPLPMQAGNGQFDYHGQPVQNPMGFGPVQVPPSVQGAPAAKPKKNFAGLIVGILCAAAVVIVIVVGALAAKVFLGGTSPEKQLAQGFAIMTEEMAAYRSPFAEEIGLDALNKLRDTDPVHTNVDLSFTDPNEISDISNINLELDSITDYQKKMAKYGLSAGAYGFGINVANIVAADNTIYLSVPLLFNNDVYSMELTNLGRDFNNSGWSSYFLETLPEDFSMTLFEDFGSRDGVGIFGEEGELWKIVKEQSEASADSVKFEFIEQKREFGINGTTAEYGGVRFTIDKDMYNDILEAIHEDFLSSDFYNEYLKRCQFAYGYYYGDFKEQLDQVIDQTFGIRVEQDIVYDFYLDKKGRIINISTPGDIAVSSKDSYIESYAIDIDFTGTERALDSIEGGIYVKAGEEILYMGISRTAVITEDQYSENLTLSLQENISDDEITFWYANEWDYDDLTFDLKMAFDVPGSSLGINVDGAFTDIVKGESFTLQLDHGEMTIDGEDMLLMRGSVVVEPAENEIEVPDHTIDVFEMSESDVEDLFYNLLYQ